MQLLNVCCQLSSDWLLGKLGRDVVELRPENSDVIIRQIINLLIGIRDVVLVLLGEVLLRNVLRSC